MTIESFTKNLQAKYNTLNDIPFNIVNININVPGDDLANDVTVYLDKESAMTVESLAESELVRFGHTLLEDVYLQLAAPPQCSLHLAYQFFDGSTKAYKDDETYYVGEWWEDQQGFWIARVYLNFVYNEQVKDELTYDSWINGRQRLYWPEPSKLLHFTNANQFKQFWELVLQAPKYAGLPVKTVVIDDLGHKYKCVEIMLTPAGGTDLKKDEYTAIVLGWRFFMYAHRFYKGKMRKIWVKVTAGEETLMSFESQDKFCAYESWLDEEPTEFKLNGPVVFNGRAKREFKKYIHQRFRRHWLFRRVRIHMIKVLEKKGDYVSVTVDDNLWFFMGKNAIDNLLRLMEKLIWDVYSYFDRPRRCTLSVQQMTFEWHMSVRLDEIDGGYRMICKSNQRTYGPLFFDDGGMLAKLSERFQKDWDQYRYVYRPVKEVEA